MNLGGPVVARVEGTRLARLKYFTYRTDLFVADRFAANTISKI